MSLIISRKSKPLRTVDSAAGSRRSFFTIQDSFSRDAEYIDPVMVCFEGDSNL